MPGQTKRIALLACPESVERFKRPEKKLLYCFDFSAFLDDFAGHKNAQAGLAPRL